MPVQTIPGTDLTYFLIAYDGEGRERAEPSGDQLSQRVVQAVAAPDITDVFIFSHGWQGDLPSSIAQNDLWIRQMALAEADLARAQQVRPGFQALRIGLHW